MAPLPRRAFAADLAALDEHRLRALVADLWAARGWETTVEGDRVVATADGARERIAVVAGGGLTDRLAGPETLSGADVVVDARGSDSIAAAARDAGAEYVGPASLRRQLLYAVERPVAEDLVAEYLGGSVAGDASSPTPTARVAVAAMVTGLLLVGLTVAAWTGWPGDGSGADPAAGVGASTGGPGTPDGPVATRTFDSAGTGTASRSNGQAVPYPPGVTPDGIQDASELASAHESTLLDRQYAVSLRFDGPAAATGFADWESIRWNLTVAGQYEYRVDARYRWQDADRPTRVDVYGQGTRQYRRIDRPNETVFDVVPNRDSGARAYDRLLAALVERYLTTGRSSVERVVRGERTLFHVVALGVPAGLNDAADAYRADAWVTPEGRVVQLHVNYRLEGEAGGSVQVSFVYGRSGSVTVTEPDWLQRARNETGD